MSSELQPVEPLSPAEVAELERNEQAIRDGIDTFMKVGMALCRIRDQRLYRATHATFADYVDKVWFLSRTRAYELIQASAIAEQMSAIADTPEIANEGQARALAPVVKLHGPEAGAAVLKEIEGEGEKVTAKKIAAKAKPKVTPKPARPKSAKAVVKTARRELDKLKRDVEVVVLEKALDNSPDPEPVEPPEPVPIDELHDRPLPDLEDYVDRLGAAVDDDDEIARLQLRLRQAQDRLDKHTLYRRYSEARTVLNARTRESCRSCYGLGWVEKGGET